MKAISIKLSQGAKPGLGGVLPGAKVSPEIAAARGVPVGRTVVSPPAHSAFSTPTEFVQFVATLRRLSGGKPVGFKLCIGARTEFLSICKAILATGISPDFVIVDGSEGGTGSAPQEFEDNVGMPLTEGLMLVHNALVGTGLRDRIRIGASGKVASGVDIVSRVCQGADFTMSARAMMFAVGCIQAMKCNTNHCPTGVTTQDPARTRAPRRAGQDHPGVRLPARHGGQRGADRRVDGPGRLPRTVTRDAQSAHRGPLHPHVCRDLRMADAGRSASGPAGVLAVGLGDGERRRVPLTAHKGGGLLRSAM